MIEVFQKDTEASLKAKSEKIWSSQLVSNSHGLKPVD